MARGSGGEGKGTASARRPSGAIRVGDAPLSSLSRDQLSVFLYVALTPEETKGLVKQLGLGIPGFRTGSLGDVERCDVIADEIRAHAPSGKAVLDLLVKAFEGVPLARTRLDARGARDLLVLGGGDAALALSLWRVLSDLDEKVRAVAAPVLDELAAHYFSPEGGKGPAPEGAAGMDDPEARADALAGALAEAEKRVEDAARRVREAEERGAQRVEEARRKGEEQREKLQGALREARAQESRAVEDAARSREEAAQARTEAERARAELEALRGTDAVSDAQRARTEARDLLAKVGSLETRLERAREREAELAVRLERAESARPAPAAPEPAQPPADEAAEAGELEQWLFPVYTREFYDSLEGWDRRIQRAAFKQAHLLALDHRHPSLRALPLEGLPGYYRVRVATDVRLIYRRPERQNTVEILSLIDREDLDRYIRQAKTRG
ncbi:MAG TPA: hypothetical protein VFM53_08365 [Anaeromyxobacteraceae bacterium]|nr:hypothetical protein [Anaeromyxobacteraceae bacterium]